MHDVVWMLISWFYWDGWIARAARSFAVGIGFGILTARFATMFVGSASPLVVGIGVIVGAVFAFRFRPLPRTGGTDSTAEPARRPSPVRVS
jgi:hypothetical protein